MEGRVWVAAVLGSEGLLLPLGTGASSGLPHPSTCTAGCREGCLMCCAAKPVRNVGEGEEEMGEDPEGQDFSEILS